MSFLSKDNEDVVWGLLSAVAVCCLVAVGMYAGIQISHDDLAFKPFTSYSNGYVVNKGFLEVSRDAGFNYYKCLTWFNGKQYFDFDCMKAVDAQKKKEYLNTMLD